MLKKKDITYNPFFLIPFLAWAVGGGILLLVFTRDELFFSINRNYTDFLDAVMPGITLMGQAEIIIPALLLLMLIPKFRNLEYFLLAALCNLIPFIVQQVLKSVFDLPRPSLYYHNRLWVHRSPEWPMLMERSFPSGHSAGAFSFYCFLSLLLPVKYRKFGFLFFLLAMLVCYSRMYLAAHFFDDIYAGSIIGTALTTITYSVMNTYKGGLFKKKNTIS